MNHVSMEFTIEEQHLFFHAFTHASIGWALVTPEGEFIKVNSSFCEFLGYSPEELNTINFQLLTHLDDLLEIMKNDERLLSGEVQSYQMETRYMHKQGHMVWGLINVSAMLNEHREPSFFIAQIVDITKNKQAEEAVNRFRSLYNSISDGIAIFDTEGKIIQVNGAFEQMFGWSESEIQGKRLPVTPDFTLDHALDLIQETLKGTVINGVETVNQRKDGGLIPVSITMSPILDEKGNVTACAGIVRDITEQRAVWAELLKSQELYRLISENAQDIITYTSPEGIIQYVSPAMKHLLGYEPDEVIGRSAFEIWHPEDFAYLWEIGILINGDVDTLTYRNLHKDGHYIWFETTLKYIRNEHGNVEKVLAVGRDITERKRKDEQLRASKHQLESFVDHNLDPILIFDDEDNLIRVNDAFEQTYGWTSDELLGLHVNEVPFVPEDKKMEVERNKTATKSGKGIMYETERMKKDGSLLPVLLSCFSMRDEKDNIAGWAVLMRDVTERKHAEELMVNSEKLSIAGQLAAGIAHEIRNPVTAIKGFLHLVHNGNAKKDYLDIMASEIERIELILSELLVLAKPQTLKFERKDILLILAQVTTLLGAQALLNNVEIITEFDSEDTYLQCDENQLKQVFINFIKNAIDAMPSGGKLNIQLKSCGEEQLLIRFIDEGCGIPRHILTRLGEPFYTTKEKGTGLGFMVSKRIIKNHNGSLQVFSEENKGTTIEIVLPVTIERGAT